MKPSYDQLELELHQTKLELHQTKLELHQTRDLLKRALEEIEKLRQEVADLKAQINRNSKNSSKPPSTDQKRNTTSDNQKKNRPPREGKARVLFPPERVDLHVQCTQENCPHCGSVAIGLNGQAPEVLQQAELPEVKATITEYELLKYGCHSCGKNFVANLPIGIPDSAFGPKYMGLLATLTGVFHLAKREAVSLIKELYGIDMGIGSVSNIEERVANALNTIYERIHNFVLGHQGCKHFDETGWRNQGQKHYVWLAGSDQAAFYMIDESRSAQAFQKLIKMNLEHISATTDRYAVYNGLKTHQYCLAHLIRDFRNYAEKTGLEKEIGGALEKELQKVCHTHKQYRKEKISLKQRNSRLKKRKKKVKFHLEDGFANGNDSLSKLCERLLNEFDKLWTFIDTPGMEPTNNLAERDLRKLVVWRKKSYGTRSERGKKFVERVTTVAQTLKKQGKRILGFFQEAVSNFYRGTSAPFVSEAMGF